ncbi:hypothetical protein, partial [Xanthomonas campestris]|uniref:hypothetical protein n=1 Tax=Xanthomonas campestris TaxID=339 RepID=UPI001E65D863
GHRQGLYPKPSVQADWGFVFCAESRCGNPGHCLPTEQCASNRIVFARQTSILERAGAWPVLLDACGDTATR